MAVFFSSTELIDIAVGIETSGAAFYDVLANSAGDKKAREAYKYLADNEREHIKIFQNMNAGASEYPSPESYTEEYADYLGTLVDSAVFVNDKAARKMARQVANEAEAIEIGIRAEKDSILFYSAIRDLVRRTDSKLIGKVIEEERSHLTNLSDLRQSLGNQR